MTAAYRPSGPLAIQITVVHPLPEQVLAAAVRGADVPLRDSRHEPVRHYLPIGSADFEQALALLARLAGSSTAIQTGRWRAAIVPATKQRRVAPTPDDAVNLSRSTTSNP